MNKIKLIKNPPLGEKSKELKKLYDLMNNQKDIPGEFVEIVNKN